MFSLDKTVVLLTSVKTSDKTYSKQANGLVNHIISDMMLTSIEQQSNDMVIVRIGNVRRWKLISLVLGILCLILTSVIVFMISRRLSLCQSSTPSVIAVTANRPTNISHFGNYQSFGLSLSHSMYTNIAYPCFPSHYILQRYPFMPKRNTTDWQTINTPSGKFPVAQNHQLAIGMHDHSDTNEIHAVRSTISLHGRNITNKTKTVLAQNTEGFFGVAFIYTVVENGKKKK
ncbi:hypothetical protein I4U23_020227 [Adineta vaga]|nr:hypothetical protein I4U23_020227 [Adineta vaga]